MVQNQDKPKQPLAIQLAKSAFHYAKYLVELLGILLMFILAAWSIAALKGVTVTYSLPLDKLMKGNFPYIWIAVVIVYVVGTLVSVIVDIKRAIQKKKIGDTGNTMLNIIKWFFSH